MRCSKCKLGNPKCKFKNPKCKNCTLDIGEDMVCNLVYGLLTIFFLLY